VRESFGFFDGVDSASCHRGRLVLGRSLGEGSLSETSSGAIYATTEGRAHSRLLGNRASSLWRN